MTDKFKLSYWIFAYIIVQFLWWEVLLVRQNNQIISLEQKIQALNTTDLSRIKKIQNDLSNEQIKRTWMFAGEGTVFLLFLIYGFYKLQNAYHNEVSVNRRQNNFLLSLPHELKTPLGIVQLNLQTLLKNKDLSEDKKEQIALKSVEELKRLQKLIDQLLLSNKIANGKLILNTEQCNLSQLISDMVTHQYKNKNIKSSIQENIFALVDKDYFQILLTNLIDNALKFCDTYTEVVLKQNGNQTYLEIINDGAIIPIMKKKKYLNYSIA